MSTRTARPVTRRTDASATHAGLVLTTGAVVGLAGVVLMPRLLGTQAENLEVIATYGTRFLTASALTYTATLLIALGFALLGRTLAAGGHRRAAWWPTLASLGWLLHTGVIAINAATYELARSPARTEMAAAAESLFSGPVFLTLLVPMLLTTIVGMVGTSIVLWRTGLAPAWIAALLTVALIADFITPERISGIPMFILLTIASGALMARSRTRVLT